MKKILHILIACLVAIVISTQVEAAQVLNFQGVLKNANETIRPNTEAVITLEFLQEGVVVYSESHNITTNINGYFSIHPGGGEVLSGNFDTIDWGCGAIVMRTLLDSEVIATTPLTAVPYALYAERVEGWDALCNSIDSVADSHYQTSLQLDDMIISYEQLSLLGDSLSNRIELLRNNEEILSNRIDSLGRSEYILSQHLDSLRQYSNILSNQIDSLGRDEYILSLHIDSLREYSNILSNQIDSMSRNEYLLSLQIDSLQQYNDSLSQHLDTLFAGINHSQSEIAKGANIFNATLYAPLDSGNFHSISTAIDATPRHLRHSGTVVTFRCDSINWRSIQYTGIDTTSWNDTNHWNEYGCYGNLTIPYIENDSITRLSIAPHMRHQGLIVTFVKDSLVRNEQYLLSDIDDLSWVDADSWLTLSVTQDEVAAMQELVDSLNNYVQTMSKDYEALLDVGKYYYIDQKAQFSQAGAINMAGNAVPDYDMVHTDYIPISEMFWIIRTYGNNTYPGITFFKDKTPRGRIPYIYDDVTESKWQLQTFDFRNEHIPAEAQYFIVNMPLEKKKEIELSICNKTTNTPIEVDTHTYQRKQSAFTYNGAFVGITGKRSINTAYSHSYFIPIDEIHYKIYATGNYQQDLTVPLIVYYSDLSFSACVGYDLGTVKDDRTTYGEIAISPDRVPEDAQYFIVNNCPKKQESVIMYGHKTDDIILDTQTRVSNLESNKSSSYDRKLVTIGDSFTINTGNRSKLWQEMLVDWLGVVWSHEETYSGEHGYAPMGLGGSWILPNDINSFSIRSRDIRRYTPDIVVIYGGQNDKLEHFKLGSIEDEPFIPENVIDLVHIPEVNSVATALSYMNIRYPKKNNTVIHIFEDNRNKLYYMPDTTHWDDHTAWVAPIDTISFYSAYKGIVQRLFKEVPLASIYCLTLMQCDSTRYDNSLGEWEDVDSMRRTKNEAIKEIAEYYGVNVIDLWNKSGITPLNARSHYHDWLHPNQYGYRRLAECIYRHLK